MSSWIIPKSRIDGLLFTDLGTERLVYDSEHMTASSLTRLAICVLNNCDGQASFAHAAKAIKSEYGEALSDEAILLALVDLQKHNLVDGKIPQEHTLLSRRSLIRAGLAGVALPVVLSIVVPTAASAASCVASGGTVGPRTFPGLGNSGTCISNLEAFCCSHTAAGGSCTCTSPTGPCTGSVTCF
jgi:hypothetical protein